MLLNRKTIKQKVLILKKNINFNKGVMFKIIKKIIFYILAFLIIEFAIIYNLYKGYNNKKEQYLSKKTNELQVAYSVIINSYSKLSQTIFDEVINKNEVLDLYKDSYNADESKRNDVRQRLFSLLNPSYQNLNSKSSVFLHFQLSDCTSFLRFYQPNVFGDNLGFLRSTIKIANEKRIVTQGFEIGSFYHGYRFIYPLFFNDFHIGSVEIGISNKAIKNEMEKVFCSHFNFIINKDVAQKNISADILSKFVKSNFDDDFLSEEIKDKASLNANPAEIENKFDPGNKLKMDISGKIKKNIAFSLDYRIQNDDYIISLIPIFNYEGLKIAYLISYSKDGTIKEYRSDLYEKILLFSILLLAILIFIKVVYHTFGVTKKNRDFLQSVTDNISEGLIVLNKNLKVISINHTAEKILDLNIHEAKGRNFENIVECKDEHGHILSPSDWPIFSNINYGFAYKSRDEFFVINKRQAEIPLELSVAPHYQKTELIGYLIVCKVKMS
jgi:PAS domain-containing protein